MGSQTNTQRATAKALLQHPFITTAGPTAELGRLIQRYAAYRQANLKASAPAPDQAGTVAGTMGGMEWDFDETIRGTVKGMPIHLDLEALGASIDQTTGPQERIPSFSGGPSAGTVRMSTLNQAQGDARATSTVRPHRKEEVDAQTPSIEGGTSLWDLGELEAQDAHCVGAIREGFSQLAERNPELIARIVGQLMGEMDKPNLHAASTSSSDNDLITERGPIADLLYQRCEWCARSNAADILGFDALKVRALA